LLATTYRLYQTYLQVKAILTSTNHNDTARSLLLVTMCSLNVSGAISLA